MKNLTALVAGLIIFGTVPFSGLRSQQVQPNSALQALQAMKAANQALLTRQATTLTTLDSMSAEAKQLRIFSKRS